MTQTNQPGSQMPQEQENTGRQQGRQQEDTSKGFTETNLDEDDDLANDEDEDTEWEADGSDGGAESDGGDA